MKDNSVLFTLLFLFVNSLQLVHAQSVVNINEVYSRGVAGNRDWIEIYNSSSSLVDISGYKIYDGGGKVGSKPKKLFPIGSVLSAKGFLVIIVDTASFAGDQSDFGLSNNGDTTWVENTSGIVVDSVFIPALGTDTSFARVPDGSNNFAKRSPVTRGTTNGTGTSVHFKQVAVEKYSLQQNFPNPFNPTTIISYQLLDAGNVSLKIYDLVGREVTTLIDQRQAAGEYHVPFNGATLSGGVYFYRLNAGHYSEMKKMILLK